MLWSELTEPEMSDARGIAVIFGCLTIIAGVSAEAVRGYADSQRKRVTRAILRPQGMDDTKWSHERARLYAERRGGLEVASWLTDNAVSVLVQLTVVCGVIAGIPWLVIVLGVLVPIIVIRLLQKVPEVRSIRDRLNLLADIRTCVSLDLSTPFYREDQAKVDEDICFGPPGTYKHAVSRQPRDGQAGKCLARIS